MSIRNSYERYSQPLNISMPEVCIVHHFCTQTTGYRKVFLGLKGSEIYDSATKKKSKSDQLELWSLQKECFNPEEIKHFPKFSII